MCVCVRKRAVGECGSELSEWVSQWVGESTVRKGD